MRFLLDYACREGRPSPSHLIPEDLLERININPQVMLGKPVIRGTRITVEILLEKIAAGSAIDDILVDYPGLTREDVLAAVGYARDVLSTDGILLGLHIRR